MTHRKQAMWCLWWWWGEEKKRGEGGRGREKGVEEGKWDELKKEFANLNFESKEKAVVF